MATPQQPIKPIIVKIKDPCPNPIMIVWLNSLGGFSEWLFERDQEVNSSFAIGDEIETFYDDIQTAVTPLKRAETTFNDTWGLFADRLTDNEVRAISEINISPQVYAVKQNGDKIGVIASTPSTNYSRFDTLYSISIQVTFPKDFNPERWLES